MGAFKGPPKPTPSVYFHHRGLKMGLDLGLRLRLAPGPPQPVCESLGHDADSRGLVDHLVEVRPPKDIAPVRCRQELLQVTPAAPVARVDGVVEVCLDFTVFAGGEVERYCERPSVSTG